MSVICYNKKYDNDEDEDDCIFYQFYYRYNLVILKSMKILLVKIKKITIIMSSMDINSIEFSRLQSTDILAKLHTLEHEINIFLCFKDKKTSLLRDKISTAFNLITELSLKETNQKNVTVWKEKRSHWLKQYLGINLMNRKNDVNEEKNKEEVFEVLEVETTSQYHNYKKQKAFTRNVFGTNRLNRSYANYQTHPLFSYYFKPYSSSDDDGDGNDHFEIKRNIHKKKMAGKLFRIFNYIGPVYDDMHPSGLDTMLGAIVDALYLIPPDLDNVELQSMAFKFAFEKLSKNLRNHFSILYCGDEHSLYSLFNFLRFQLNASREFMHTHEHFNHHQYHYLCNRCFGHRHGLCSKQSLFLWPKHINDNDSIRSKLSSIFNPIRPIKLDDIRNENGQNSLIAPITSALQLIAFEESSVNLDVSQKIATQFHYHSHSKFAFNLAFSKLPKTVQLLYRTQYSAKQESLRELYNFIHIISTFLSIETTTATNS